MTAALAVLAFVALAAALGAATPGYDAPDFCDESVLAQAAPDYARIAADARLEAEADAWLRALVESINEDLRNDA